MAETNVKYTVMGREHEAERGASLLGELRKNGYEVPSLCYHEELSPYGACRLCLVEVKKGKRTKLTTSCNYPVQAGIEVSLDTDKVVRNRRMVLELLLARAPKAPEGLRALADRYGVKDVRFPLNGDEDCILCGLCSRACREIVGVDALTFSGRGDRKAMGPAYQRESESCILCGACVYVCPVGCVDMSESGGRRRIRRWHRELPLVVDKLGMSTMTTAQAAYMARRTGLPVETFGVPAKGGDPKGA
jgi:NADH dehydrogenase/NADH:ubiquinone oxidoreductase subunit G